MFLAGAESFFFTPQSGPVLPPFTEKAVVL